MNHNKNDECYLITGAAKRIGKALALGFAARGIHICLHYNSSEKEAEKTASEVRKLGVKCIPLKVNLSSTKEVEALLDASWNFQPLTGLINNASIFDSTTLDSETTDTWNKTFAINLTSPMLLSKLFAQRLNRNSGAILNLLDFRYAKTDTEHFGYGLSKSALGNLTKTLAVALAPSIRVNGLALGAILPPPTPYVEKKILAKVPLKRWGTLEEVVDAAAFLCLQQSSITGEILHIDGGRHLN